MPDFFLLVRVSFSTFPGSCPSCMIQPEVSRVLVRFTLRHSAHIFIVPPPILDPRKIQVCLSQTTRHTSNRINSSREKRFGHAMPSVLDTKSGTCTRTKKLTQRRTTSYPAQNIQSFLVEAAINRR